MVYHVPEEDIMADGLTKPLGREKHTKFVKMLGMTPGKVPWNVK